jgi:RAB protein geranylgeranyltransferase component A
MSFGNIKIKEFSLEFRERELLSKRQMIKILRWIKNMREYENKTTAWITIKREMDRFLSENFPHLQEF